MKRFSAIFNFSMIVISLLGWLLFMPVFLILPADLSSNTKVVFYLICGLGAAVVLLQVPQAWDRFLQAVGLRNPLE